MTPRLAAVVAIGCFATLGASVGLLLAGKDAARYQRSKPRIREYMRRYLAANPSARISRALAGRIRHALNGIGKIARTQALIGCSMADLRAHLGRLFQSGMTWENYGQWHIDHVVPCSAFDLRSESAQRRCFHFTNLQPLWASDNFRKSSKVPPTHQYHLL